MLIGEKQKSSFTTQFLLTMEGYGPGTTHINETQKTKQFQQFFILFCFAFFSAPIFYENRT